MPASHQSSWGELLLMQVLRLMENEEIEPEEVDKDLRPTIDDYVERSEEAFDEFGDVDGLYPAALIEQMDSLETQMPASAALQVSITMPVHTPGCMRHLIHEQDVLV